MKAEVIRVEIVLSILMTFPLVGCQSSSVSPMNIAPSPTAPSPTVTTPKPAIAIGYDWRGDWTSTDFSIVEMDQGLLPADTLQVCHATLVAGQELSNRKTDECDRIAAKGLVHQMHRDAEEKLKDNAYDKAHPKTHP